MNFFGLFKKYAKPAKVATYYDSYTSKYLEVVPSAIQSHRSENETEMFEYFLNVMGIEDDMHLLDVGCGVCGPAVYFAGRKNIKIDAINVSDYQLKVAVENINKANLQDRINIYKGDFHQMDLLLKKNDYDIIYFLEAYGHSINPKKLLSTAAKMLKSGGVLYIKEYFQKDMCKMVKVKKVAARMNKYYAYNLPCLYKTISILRKLNFEIEKIGVPQYKHDMGKSAAKFAENNNINLFEGEEKMFSYADIMEIVARKIT